MCGFAALIDFYGSEDLRDRISAMLASIVHRGPDDAGIEVDGPVALGFRRLSILDLSPAGHQPMQSADGNCTIVFNGEIYNYLELRAELILRGHSFKSTGDTEVLLAAYHEWGEDCLHRLNGMWAFLIHDRKRQLLFGSRDRFGIKPLFRFQDGRRAIFSSEIKAIRASGLYTTELNLSACAAHLHEGRQDQTSATYYQGIQQIPAGHAFELRLEGGYREWKYWDVLHCQTAAPEDPPQAFAELFEDAMRVHMRSDVPVGVNLSGGLDSTSILCAAARLRQESGASKDLLAFCYQDRGFDESAYIRDTLGLTGATLVPLELTPEQLWDSLPTVLSFQDEPVHSMTALVGFHLMALAARNGVKVILNGQGADEVIGGYGSYFNDRWSELIRSGHAREAWQEISDYSQAHGGAAGPRFRRALQHVVQSALGTLQPYRAVARRRRLTRARAREWLRPELLDHLPPPLPGHDSRPE